MNSFDDFLNPKPKVQVALAEYQGIDFVRAAVDFPGSEKLDKLKKVFLFWFGVVLFLEIGSVGFSPEATLFSGIRLEIGRPWLLHLGFWAIYLYAALSYWTLLQTERGVYKLTTHNRAGFFAQLHRKKIEPLVDKAFGGRVRLSPQPERLISDHPRETVLGYGMIGIKDEERSILEKIPGWIESPDPSRLSPAYFKYEHTDADEEYYRRHHELIDVGVRTNYLQYILPIHATYVLITYRFLDWLNSVHKLLT